jgi:hypothetical protein
VLQSEHRKRLAAIDSAGAFGDFRRKYLSVANEADFTPTRIGFHAPELAFPVFARILDAWRTTSYCERYGRLALYPVPRKVLPVDSVLNWWELWRERPSLTVGGLLRGHNRALYLEMNEDFNLHLKLGSEAEGVVDRVRSKAMQLL